MDGNKMKKTSEAEEASGTENSRLVQKEFKGSMKLVKYKQDGIVMTERYAEVGNRIKNFEFRPDDVVILTYPKSGTTWLLEIVWAMRNIHQLTIAEEEPISSRYYFIDADALYTLERQLTMESQMEKFHSECPGKDPKDGIVLQLAAASQVPRIIKTHLPISVFSESILDSCKIIYVCRDPRDVCVSYYHHYRLIKTYQYEGSFEQFVGRFMDDEIAYGSYWNHVASAWEHRSHRNLHFMFYEDLKRGAMGELKRLDEFLGCHLKDKQLQIVAEHSSFDSMKARDQKAPMSFSSSKDNSRGSFFRKGTVGDWKNVATQSLDERMTKWVNQSVHELGIDFDRYL